MNTFPISNANREKMQEAKKDSRNLVMGDGYRADVRVHQDQGVPISISTKFIGFRGVERLLFAFGPNVLVRRYTTRSTTVMSTARAGDGRNWIDRSIDFVTSLIDVIDDVNWNGVMRRVYRILPKDLLTFVSTAPAFPILATMVLVLENY